MPESVSVLKSSDKILNVKDWLGVKVPWEVKGYAEDMIAAETSGGIFDLSSWATLEFIGPDAVDYLQRMTTVNFKTLSDKTATYGAFLTGKGTVISLGMFIRDGEKTTYITTEHQRVSAFEHIEKFHFAENFQLVDVSEKFSLVAWLNPSKTFFDELHVDGSLPPGPVEWRRWKSLDLEIWKDPARPKLLYFLLDRRMTEKFLFEFERISIPLLGHRVFENLRIRAGVPELGVDLTEKEIILESGFDLSVHRNKGCYPGQEVVERIFTYGSVNKKLIPVVLEGTQLEKIGLPYELTEKESKMGQLVSLSSDPKDSSKGWGLAYLHKEFWNRKCIKL